MTSQGASEPLKADGTYAASLACQVRNGPFLCPDENGGSEILSHICNNSWAAYRYFFFEAPRSFTVTAAARINGGIVEIWADDEVIGSCLVPPTGGWNVWQSFTCDLLPVTGVKTLYLTFHGNDLDRRLMDIKEFTFRK